MKSSLILSSFFQFLAVLNLRMHVVLIAVRFVIDSGVRESTLGESILSIFETRGILFHNIFISHINTLIFLSPILNGII